MHYIYMLLILIGSLHSGIKNNLSGSSYSRIEAEKTTIYKEKTPWISAYKSLRAEPRTDVISLYFQYVIPVDLLTITLGSGSTLVSENSMMKLDAGTETIVTSTVTTKKSINYSPGHEISTFFTAMFPTPTASGGHHTRYIGMFTAQDGLALGYQNNTFGILYMKNSTVTFTPQSSFNLDKLDGTGNSSFVLDPTKLNIFYIAYGWLGAAPLEFGICTENGTWVPFHRISYPNLYESPSLLNPSLPIALAVSKNNSGTGTLSILTASWNANITGKEHHTRIHTATQEAKTITGSTFTPILSLTNKSNYTGKTSTARMRILYANFSGYSSGNQIRVRFYKEPTLSGESFSDVDSMLSVAQKDTSATSFSSTGTLLFQTSVYSQSNANFFFKENGILIDLYPGETLSIAGSESGSGGVTMDASITWEELL